MDDVKPYLAWARGCQTKDLAPAIKQPGTRKAAGWLYDMADTNCFRAETWELAVALLCCPAVERLGPASSRNHPCARFPDGLVCLNLATKYHEFRQYSFRSLVGALRGVCVSVATLRRRELAILDGVHFRLSFPTESTVLRAYALLLHADSLEEFANDEEVEQLLFDAHVLLAAFRLRPHLPGAAADSLPLPLRSAASLAVAARVLPLAPAPLVWLPFRRPLVRVVPRAKLTRGRGEEARLRAFAQTTGWSGAELYAAGQIVVRAAFRTPPPAASLRFHLTSLQARLRRSAVQRLLWWARIPRWITLWLSLLKGAMADVLFQAIRWFA